MLPEFILSKQLAADYFKREGAKMKYYKKMVGNRLYLSPINADDAENYIKWMNDEAVTKNFAQYSSVVSSKSELKWLFEPGSGVQRYAMVLLDGDKLIGSISLHDINPLNRTAFFGIFIGEEEHRSKGYGAEAIRLILNYGFKTMNLNNIMLSVHADNVAGISCYKKVGFREAGRRREWVFKDGKYVDVIYMDLLAREFAG
jgi:RimJ/RimL family protein N-acetyltransferase